jgi:hypothetical protein
MRIMLKGRIEPQEVSLYSDEEVRAALRDFVSSHPTQQEAAGALGIKPAYLSDILGKRRGVSDNVARRLGFVPTSLPWEGARNE